MAPAHEHAHGAAAPAAAGHRGRAGLARAAALERPERVVQYFADNPDLAPVLDSFQMFDVYTSVWFSAIYLLLFVSLIGCIIPRTKHHFEALRARPPRTPGGCRACRRTPSGRLPRPRRGLDRLDPTAAEAAIDAATAALKKSGYRVERYDLRGAASVSAERGYLRETGNPSSTRRPCSWRWHRRRLRLLRPARDRRGPVVREHARGVRLVQPGPVLRRHAAHALPAHARRARRGVRDREPRRARPGDRLHGARHGAGAGGEAERRSR